MLQRKILIVEDEVLIGYDLKSILEREGYEVIIDCFSVDMAIDIITKCPPDLLLIDINLQDKKNGFDLARFLESDKRIPYIFITSYSDKSTLTQAAGLSPAGYILKPFKSKDIITTVFLALSKLTPNRNIAKDNSSFPFAITQVLDYINSHLQEKLDLRVLAAHTAWEPEHFGRIFKEYVGLTPYQYILKSRIELSKKLLEQPHEYSKSICYEVGFSNYSNFYNAFKKYMKMSPEQYRKIKLRHD